MAMSDTEQTSEPLRRPASDARLLLDERLSVCAADARAIERFGVGIIGQSICRWLRCNSGSPVESAIAAAMDPDGGFSLGAEGALEALGARGESLPVGLEVGELVTDEGAFLLAIVRDLGEPYDCEREVEALQDEIVRLGRELEQLLFVVSHDLMQPLQTIGGFVDVLERRCASLLDERGVGYVGRIRGGVRRLKAQIDALLQLSRIDRHGGEFKSVDLGWVAEEALAMNEREVAATQASITWTELPRVYGDRAQLQQVFGELIANALQFRSERRPEIALRARREMESWVIEFADNGMGFHPDHAESIFELFRRLGGHEEGSGPGGGLTICRKILQRHGGSIVAAGHPGQGATFSITLPSQDAALEALDQDKPEDGHEDD